MGQPDTAANEPVRQVQKSAAALQGRLKTLATVRAGSANAVGDLEKGIDAIGDPDTFVAALRETLEQARVLVKEGRAARSSALQSAVAGFVKEALPVHGGRETSSGWRIGPLALEQRAPEGTIRISYNQEPMTPWTPAATPADVTKLYDAALAELAKATVPESDLGAAMVRAYDHLHATGATGQRIRLESLLEEMRIALVRDAIQRRKSKDAQRYVGLQRWALLHNFDRYRAAEAAKPSLRRLMVETGTQAETEKFGVVVGGLNPDRDYSRLCYVRVVAGA